MWLAALVCSTMAAFCWVTWSIWLTAALISPRPTDCSRAEVTIDLTCSLMRSTSSPMRCRASPVAVTSSTPVLTSTFDLPTSALMSRAASAARPARARTSWATTAKPLPASPARAASTPAFSARRLVWKAISSTTLMILPISPVAPSMRSMAAMASDTTAPDFSA
ncbi:hypothetical protein D3C87_1727440 [compost metagenome]